MNFLKCCIFFKKEKKLKIKWETFFIFSIYNADTEISSKQLSSEISNPHGRCFACHKRLLEKLTFFMIHSVYREGDEEIADFAEMKNWKKNRHCAYCFDYQKY